MDLAFIYVSLYYKPRSFIDAIGDHDSLESNEIFSHAKNNTLVPLPPQHVCIPNGWLFPKLKRINSVTSFVARLDYLPKDIARKKGLQPWVFFTCSRLQLAPPHLGYCCCAGPRDRSPWFYDDFFKSVVEDENYIAQSEGYLVFGRETDVCHLNKDIYGICQVFRIWNQLLHTFPLRFDLSNSTADPCVYHHSRLLSCDCYLGQWWLSLVILWLSSINFFVFSKLDLKLRLLPLICLLAWLSRVIVQTKWFIYPFFNSSINYWSPLTFDVLRGDHAGFEKGPCVFLLHRPRRLLLTWLLSDIFLIATRGESNVHGSHSSTRRHHHGKLTCTVLSKSNRDRIESW